MAQPSLRRLDVHQGAAFAKTDTPENGDSILAYRLAVKCPGKLDFGHALGGYSECRRDRPLRDGRDRSEPVDLQRRFDGTDVAKDLCRHDPCHTGQFAAQSFGVAGEKPHFVDTDPGFLKSGLPDFQDKGLDRITVIGKRMKRCLTGADRIELNRWRVIDGEGAISAYSRCHALIRHQVQRRCAGDDDRLAIGFT